MGTPGGIGGGIRGDVEFGFLDASVSTEKLYSPKLVYNVPPDTMYKAILEELRRSREFVFSVAFVTPDAIASLKQAFVDFDGPGTVITSTYLRFNPPESFRELLNLRDLGITVRVVPESPRGFHPKGFLFRQDESTTAIVGSSNLTAKALRLNHEWNLRFSALPGGDIVNQLDAAVEAQLAESFELTEEWVDDYAKDYTPPQFHTSAPAPGSPSAGGSSSIVPNSMQAEALAQIAALRAEGKTRALVISATGTGKTILAALDVRAVAPKKMLFVVHREQILDRAIEEFIAVLGIDESEIGKFVGSRRELDRKYVFATPQSLGSAATLAEIPRDLFDYVLVDEVHRAGAKMHLDIINHFQPDFLLGITATPERTDDFNIFALFDFNVAYEIRLQQALEAGMLAPFHYYGIADVGSGASAIGSSSNLAALLAPERVDHIVATIERYGHAGTPVRGLFFCSRNEEAARLSQALNEREVHGHKLRTRALSGADSIAERAEIVAKLQRGELDYILTVDIFNEGVDIRSINQIVMLRQTTSAIVFTQQLGRGLRKSKGKDYLVVIDFIGNYESNFLVPIALFGDKSLNKDSIRRQMIEAQDVGNLAGLSSVNFDEISKERIFRALDSAKLDSIRNLKKVYEELRARMGETPALLDYALQDVVDPVVLARAKGNYWTLLNVFDSEMSKPSKEDSAVLDLLSGEVLNGKRPHELLLLKALLDADSGELPEDDAAALFAAEELAHDEPTLESVRRILDLEFFTSVERKRYTVPLVDWSEGKIRLGAEFRSLLGSSGTLEERVRDCLDTGLFLARHRYVWAKDLEIGKKYSRKDVCRLLNWKSNQQGTIYGYKVDSYSETCPIFVTYHKHEDVSASTLYEDSFRSESTLRWFTRSSRTLKSAEVAAIVDNTVPLYLFAKKDDGEGSDFYYLGQAEASNPEQTTMPGGKGKPLDVVTMDLNLEVPVGAGLYDYLVGTPTTTVPLQNEVNEVSEHRRSAAGTRRGLRANSISEPLSRAEPEVSGVRPTLGVFGHGDRCADWRMREKQ
ncbi:DEAD/DEAH box helicase [Dietzia sp.]|uniref:DEAD/DEAH box helicase n=1 Tax=Dietzia sp. TaxID=1871616 RepID=UPI002FDB15EE